jgi:hypothetical protein
VISAQNKVRWLIMHLRSRTVSSNHFRQRNIGCKPNAKSSLWVTRFERSASREEPSPWDIRGSALLVAQHSISEYNMLDEAGYWDHGNATVMQNATVFCTSPAVRGVDTGKLRPGYTSMVTWKGIAKGLLWAFCAGRGDESLPVRLVWRPGQRVLPQQRDGAPSRDGVPLPEADK